MAMLHIDQAARIVTELDNVLPYEVEIMDSNGIIIASSNSDRTGHVNVAAVKCMEMGDTVKIEESSEINKMGVYSPLYFENQLMGAVGLLGNIGKVEPYIKLVRVTSELLIAQEHNLRVKQQKRQSINEYLQEWLFLDEEYSESFIERGKQLNIHVNNEYRAVLVNGVEDMEYGLACIRGQLEMGDYWYAINTQAYIIVTRHHDTLNDKLLDILAAMPNCSIGAGRVRPLLNRSYLETFEALKLGSVLAPSKKIYYYEKLEFINALVKIGDQEMYDMVDKLYQDNQGMELINTVRIYVANNGEIGETAKELFIHRNTLKYRLDKINSITGKDPRAYEDLFYLHTAIIYYIVSKNR